jgi:hypothetical protein
LLGRTNPTPADQPLRLEHLEIEVLGLEPLRCDGTADLLQIVEGLDRIQFLNAGRLDAAATERREPLARQFRIVSDATQQLLVQRPAGADHVVDLAVERRTRDAIAENPAEEILLVQRGIHQCRRDRGRIEDQVHLVRTKAVILSRAGACAEGYDQHVVDTRLPAAAISGRVNPIAVDSRHQVMADNNFSFPFDLNHLSILKYEHLGKDIGFSEAMRVRASQSAGDDALVDHLLARRIRRDVLSICDRLLQAAPAAQQQTDSDEPFWIGATKVEALFGLGRKVEAETLKVDIVDKERKRLGDNNQAQWKEAALIAQLEKLAKLLPP